VAPWGTLLGTGLQLDFVPLIATQKLESERQLLRQVLLAEAYMANLWYNVNGRMVRMLVQPGVIPHMS